ncbi:DMT family transporter [Modestobacter sp. URMC 112]
MSAPSRTRGAALAAAPFVFVLLWSTGFVGAKYGLPYAEPFTFLALRLALAGALLAGLAVVLRADWPRSRGETGRAAVAGLLLHAGYLGGVFFAIEHGLPASVAAVVVSLQPVLTAALATRLLGERLVAVQWLGLVLGVTGVALVLAPGLASAAGETGAFPPVGVLACLVALLAGTGGTLWQKKHGDGIPMLSGTAVQYAASALVLVALAAATETMTIEWTGEFVAALVWLVLPLSLGAVLLLLLLLRRGSASGVSSLLYLVPPATAVEAWFLFGEELPLLSLVGVLVTTVGVALVLRPPGRGSGRRATMDP